MLLRKVPEALVAGVASGQYKVYGSIIMDVATNRIAGHLQETGFQQIAGLALKGAFSAADPLGSLVSAVGSVANFVQNEQIKAALSTVVSLQQASVALGIVNAGVSVAGFAILAHKIDRVRDRVDAMGARLDEIGRKIDELRLDAIEKDLVDLRTAAEQLDEGWRLASPEAQWRAVASDAHRLQNNFKRRAERLLGTNQTPPVADADTFIDAMTQALALRVAARLAAGDEAIAREAAEQGAQAVATLAQSYSVANQTFAAMAKSGARPGDERWSEDLERSADAIRPTVEAMRQRVDGAVSTALTVDELGARGIRGRAWLEEARAELEAPLLYLPGRD